MIQGLSYLVQGILRLFGWKVEGKTPDLPKFVMIGAPHTSNWDFFLFIVAMIVLKIRPYWMGKSELFKKGWIGRFLKFCGGIPVQRKSSQNAVEQVVQRFLEAETMVVVISPEGTRQKTDGWRTGFYYIALGAQVPIVLSFLDYQRKTTGIGKVFYPTGDLQKDMETIREFYQGIEAKFPDQKSSIQALPKAPRSSSEN